MEVIDNDNDIIKSLFSKMSKCPIYDKSKTLKLKVTYSYDNDAYSKFRSSLND